MQLAMGWLAARIFCCGVKIVLSKCSMVVAVYLKHYHFMHNVCLLHVVCPNSVIFSLFIFRIIRIWRWRSSHHLCVREGNTSERKCILYFFFSYKWIHLKFELMTLHGFTVDITLQPNDVAPDAIWIFGSF